MIRAGDREALAMAFKKRAIVANYQSGPNVSQQPIFHHNKMKGVSPMSRRSEVSDSGSNDLSFDPQRSQIPSIVHTAKAPSFSTGKFTFHNKRMTVQPSIHDSNVTSLNATLPQLSKADVQ